MRFIGDNVNYAVGIAEQRKEDQGASKHLRHAFASVALVHDVNTSHLPDLKPQQLRSTLTATDFLINDSEYQLVRANYIYQITKVVSKHMPYFTFLDSILPKLAPPMGTVKKTQVIPMQTVLKNEQEYSDVVDILEGYEEIIEELYKEAGVELTDSTQIHIGGDQLTRERFSGAKSLRAAERNVKDQFGHLHPITFEMFHLLMAFLHVTFGFLYSEKSSNDVGTMKCEINRVMRTQVKPDVKKAYEADKDFVVSFVDAHLVELVCEYFGLDDHLAVPTTHVPPTLETDDDKLQWTLEVFGDLVDTLAWPKSTCECSDSVNVIGNIFLYCAYIVTLCAATALINATYSIFYFILLIVVDGQYLPLLLTLANGQHLQIWPKMETKPHQQKVKDEESDKVKNYAHLVVELGLLYKELLSVCKNPSRDRLLALLKLSMVVFKTRNNNSKYALEIHRFLVQQISVLSKREAVETVEAMFVNAKGKPNSCTPADLQMEYVVKIIKKHIKHMYSNKTEQNIAKQTRALSSVHNLSQHYDTTTDVIIRSKQHKEKESAGDELMMIEDLRKLHPFAFEANRAHPAFPSIKKSILQHCNTDHYHSWLKAHIQTHTN